MANEKILIVEDDPTLRRGLQDNFAARGYQVEVAEDGEAGLRGALESGPDLVILDIMLPGINGYEICRAVRERELTMPIIMLTAKGQEEDIIRGLDLGADDYVTKPFAIAELLARTRSFLRRRSARTGDVHCFGGSALDLSSRRLLYDGAEVELTPKEFGLLEYLVLNAGRALTRDQILNNVWGSGILVTTRSVDRCVSTLRSKIEPDPRYPTYLQTIRDIGYRFEIPDTDDAGESFGSAPSRVASLVPGTRLGRYEIRCLIGRGGMSEVYQALDLKLDRDVAIKVLPRRLNRDPEVQRRFLRETRVIAALSHPNIVTLHDVGRGQGLTYAVIELLEGESLKERLDQGPLELEHAVEICVAVAEGLAAAHAKSIVHRDIKPGNIFLPRSQAPTILDFGLARLDHAPSSEETTVSVTQSGKIMGTIAYMSPEQVRGQTVDGRTDIFSLSCVLYEMITGSRPFDRESPAETMAAILADAPPRLPEDLMPPDLWRLTTHGLEKDRNDRFQSASDMVFALGGL